MPGTVNYPTKTKHDRGRVPVMATLAGATGEMYSVNELAKVFPPQTTARPKASTNNNVGEIKLLTADDLGLGALDPIRSLIDHPRRVDRSRDGLRCAGDMRREGFTKEQVAGVLLNPANKVSAHYLDQPDPRRNALLTIKRAWEDGQESTEEAKSSWRDHVMTAAALQRQTFPPIKYVVPELIPEGLSILAGRPKLGKSWMALDICIAVAAGRICLGEKKPVQGDVLYCALEDNPRRMQRRIDKLLPTFGVEWPERLTLATSMAAARQGRRRRRCRMD